MKKIQIVHNPTAGHGDHSERLLLKALAGEDREIFYVSTEDPDWQNFVENEPDIIAIGGGDGTVGKVAELLLRKNENHKQPLVKILPMGTANNIARTLDVPEFSSESANSLGKAENFNVGKIKGIDDRNFFLEAVGFGVLPKVVSEMKKKEDKSPENEIQESLETLLETVKNYKAEKAEIKTAENTISRSFLLVELMNIRFIGPNFELAPQADPGDGFFQLVMIPESSRQDLAQYVEKSLGKEGSTAELGKFVQVQLVKEISMKWHGKDVHIDDQLVENYSGQVLEIKIEEGRLRFFRG